MTTPFLIAIEGIDGAGTTTQAHLLCDWMNNHGLPAHFTCEPSTGPIGSLIRQILKKQTTIDQKAMALLFAADRLEHWTSEIEPHLSQGQYVVTDRYKASSLAYQSLFCDLAWVCKINEFAPDPGMTIYVRISPDIARDRRSRRGQAEELFEDHALQQSISLQYDNILGSSTLPGSALPDPSGSLRLDPPGSLWIHLDPSGSRRAPRLAVVDGSKSIESIHQQLTSLVQKVALQY
jgi:dTMP kinase